MKIIQKGNSYDQEPEEDVHCPACHTHFSFTKSDVNIHYGDYNINDYYVFCPNCHRKMSVSAWAEKWFE